MERRISSTPRDKIYNSNKVQNYSLNKKINIHNELILFLFCYNCKNIPIIKFINLQKAYISFNCNSEIQKMTYEEIFNKYFLNIEKNNNIIDFLICIKHNDKFKFFCDNCELNLCEKCRENHRCHLRYIKDLKIFNNEYFELDDFLLNLDDSFNALKKIILLLVKQYQEYPNYNLKQNIISFHKLNKKKEENEYINIDSIMKKDLRNLKELCLKDNKLNNEQIPILKKLNCHYLLILNLESNFFTSYSLFTVKENFTKLKEINFSSNRLYEDIDILKNKSIPYYSITKLILTNGIFSDDTIYLLSCLIFVELECLDLSSNNLTSLSFIRKINFGNKINKLKKLIAKDNVYFSINAINEYINYLKLNYVNLEQLILEEEFSIEYKGGNNLPFIIRYFDEEQISAVLIEQYEKEKNQNEIRRLNMLPDYEGFYDDRT